MKTYKTIDTIVVSFFLMIYELEYRHILSITVNTVIDRLKNKVISTTKARMNPQIKARFSVKKKLSIDRQVVNLSLSFCFSLNVQISDN